MLSSAIVGCATPQQQSEATVPTPSPTVSTPPPAASPVAPSTPEVQQWTMILKGQSTQGLIFSNDGKLLYQGKTLLAEIPVTYISDGNVNYVQRLIVSPPSPSGRFNVVKGCEEPTDDAGLCWAVFLVDRQTQTAEKIDIAKYGGRNWVQWSADERYAVFAELLEGSTWFVVLDLQTQEGKMTEEITPVADLSSFRWLNDRTFEVKVSCGDRPDCTGSTFRGNITALFTR